MLAFAMVSEVKWGLIEATKSVKIFKMEECATAFTRLEVRRSNWEVGVWVLWKVKKRNLLSWIRVVIVSV